MVSYFNCFKLGPCVQYILSLLYTLKKTWRGVKFWVQAGQVVNRCPSVHESVIYYQTTVVLRWLSLVGHHLARKWYQAVDWVALEGKHCSVNWYSSLPRQWGHQSGRAVWPALHIMLTVQLLLHFFFLLTWFQEVFGPPNPTILFVGFSIHMKDKLTRLDCAIQKRCIYLDILQAPVIKGSAGCIITVFQCLGNATFVWNHTNYVSV